MAQKSLRTPPKSPAKLRQSSKLKPETASAHARARRKPSVTIVGPGRLGSALAVALHAAGFEIDEVITNGPGKARGLARSLGAKSVSVDAATLDSAIVWITVGDSAIRGVAHQLAAAHG